MIRGKIESRGFGIHWRGSDVHGTTKTRSLFTLHAYLLFQLFMYEAMGLCPQGRGGELIDSAEWISNKNGKMFSLDYLRPSNFSFTNQWKHGNKVSQAGRATRVLLKKYFQLKPTAKPTIQPLLNKCSFNSVSYHV